MLKRDSGHVALWPVRSKVTEQPSGTRVLRVYMAVGPKVKALNGKPLVNGKHGLKPAFQFLVV